MAAERSKAALVRLPVQVAAALLKHYAKKAFGEDALGIVADELIGEGKEGALAKVDAWLKKPAALQRVARAIEGSGDMLSRSKAEPSLWSAITRLPLGDEPALREAILLLPESPDDTQVRRAIADAITRRAPARWPPEQVALLVDEYLRCLRKSLLTLKEIGPAVIGQAVLRMEDELGAIRSTVDRVEKAAKRTEQKLDALAAHWQKNAAARFRAQFIDFSAHIADKTEGFVGRRFVFEALDRFLREVSSGYLVIRGDPGIGKTAVLAQIVKERRYPHHFNIAAEGICTLGQFLRNAAAQVVARYALSYQELPAGADEDTRFLKELLTEASQKTQDGVLLVIDALDEVVVPPGDTRTNPLRLPSSLPPGVRVIASTRRTEKEREIEVESYRALELEADSRENLDDVRSFVERYARRPAMRPRIEEWGVSHEAFARVMESKSEGNFMYLHHVLPAIEAGLFRQGTVDELPQALRGYYRQHWKKMRGRDLQTFVRVNQKVIAALAVARQAVSVNFVARVARLEPAEVQWTFDAWREFLHETPARARIACITRAMRTSWPSR